MEWVLLALVAFSASAIQGLTGFGFGLIAVPSFLIILNSSSAIQLTILVTIVMSTVMWPFFHGKLPPGIVKRLIIGSVIGFPLGAGAYLSLDLDAVKIVTAVVVLAVATQTVWERFKGVTHSMPSIPKLEYAIGLLAGLLATAVAIPGPAIMLYLARTSLTKDQIRGIILTFFIFLHVGALVSQLIFVGISKETWIMSGYLSIPVVAGVLFGHFCSRFVSQALFKNITLVILLVTGGSILFNVLS